MAPVESYVRVSNEAIYEIGEITFPHIIIIFHPQVITHGKSYTMPFYFGLKEDGIALINNDGPMKLHKDQARELEERRAKLYYFPATKLSLEIAGMDLATNMAPDHHGRAGPGCEGPVLGQRFRRFRWNSGAR
jgi:pyruvate ferredoxin oxidoreductase gamma subunit